MRRFLALGDSYTIGEGVDPADRWPAHLVTLLRARGVDVDDPEIVATTGWTTDELSAAIDAAPPNGPYALVSLLVGVNDQYRGRDPATYRAQFRALVARAVAFAAGDPRRVLVLSIPDWGVTPFADGRDRPRIAAEIDDFNAIARAEAARGRTRWIDVTPATRLAGSDATQLAPDGLHPSGAMYAAWARLAVGEAEGAITGQ